MLSRVEFNAMSCRKRDNTKGGGRLKEMGVNATIKVQTLKTIRTVAAEAGSSYQAEVSLSMDNVNTHCTGGVAEHRQAARTELTMCVVCHHATPTGFIPPLCTSRYMAYLPRRTSPAPRGADCSGRQTESWDPRRTFTPSPLVPPTPCAPLPPPCPQLTAPTLPRAEGLFQLHFKLRSSRGTAAEAP